MGMKFSLIVFVVISGAVLIFGLSTAVANAMSIDTEISGEYERVSLHDSNLHTVYTKHTVHTDHWGPVHTVHTTPDFWRHVHTLHTTPDFWRRVYTLHSVPQTWMDNILDVFTINR